MAPIAAAERRHLDELMEFQSIWMNFWSRGKVTQQGQPVFGYTGRPVGSNGTRRAPTGTNGHQILIQHVKIILITTPFTFK